MESWKMLKHRVKLLWQCKIFLSKTFKMDATNWRKIFWRKKNCVIYVINIFNDFGFTKTLWALDKSLFWVKQQSWRYFSRPLSVFVNTRLIFYFWFEKNFNFSISLKICCNIQHSYVVTCVYPLKLSEANVLILGVQMVKSCIRLDDSGWPPERRIQKYLSMTFTPEQL